jgi:Holliday junction DNA helicase RuvA
MIASITGLVEEKLIDRIVVNTYGLGYEVFLTDMEIAKIETGKEQKLYIYEQIKEDVHDLYGFQTLTEKQLFEKLLSVKNVGPRVALAVLNIGSVDSVKQAIAGGDTKLLQTAKGVGRRAAEQIIVELRDKVGLMSSMTAEAIVNRSGDGDDDEAVQALVSLGYSIYDARTALSTIDQNLSPEQRITKALKERK